MIGRSVVMEGVSYTVVCIAAQGFQFPEGADANRCTTTVTRSDTSGVPGTIQCADLVAVYDNLSKNGNVNITGTFEATP